MNILAFSLNILFFFCCHLNKSSVFSRYFCFKMSLKLIMDRSGRRERSKGPAGRQDRNDIVDRTVIVNKISIQMAPISGELRTDSPKEHENLLDGGMRLATGPLTNQVLQIGRYINFIFNLRFYKINIASNSDDLGWFTYTIFLSIIFASETYFKANQY